MSELKSTAKVKMDSLTLSVFCENMSMMLGAGIQESEALLLLSQDVEAGGFHDTAISLYERMEQSYETFGEAVQGCGFFPDYAVKMIAAGQTAGRTEAVLAGLASHYDTESRQTQRLRSAVIYPAVLLLVMSMILAVMVYQVLPVFTKVYESLAGSVAASSYSYINTAYVVGWTALIVVLLICLLLLSGFILSKSIKGASFFSRLFEKLPFTAAASLRLAQAQFSGAMLTFTASGVDSDTALADSIGMVKHEGLTAKLNLCKSRMSEGRSLAQAVQETKVFDSLYARMLTSGAHSGNLEQVLSRLTEIFTEEAETRMNRVIDSIEPALAGFLTVSVGLTLLSVMLPLVGMLTAIA